MRIKAIYFLLLTWVLCCSAAEDYNRYIQKLAAGGSDHDAQSAKQFLKNAGEKAFPSLILNFGDSTPAQRTLHHGASSKRATVGSMCFEIFQIQIEGNWPKSVRGYYVLSPANAKQWLEAHQGLSLNQLRIAAKEESLRLAEAEYVTRPSDYVKGHVEFFRERIESLKNNPQSLGH